MKNELSKYYELCRDLESGKVRVAYKEGGTWHINSSVKEGILDGFKYGSMTEYEAGALNFIDKDTVPPRTFKISDGVRIVPGGTSVRSGAYLAKSVIVMPPAYVNIGAYVDEGTMIDSHALVGSCAQVGKRVHLSAGSQLGGVLEPIGAMPVIVEDDVFIGGNCGIYEGTIIRERAVIASGVILTSSTAVYDAVNKVFLSKNDAGRVEIPENAVVVQGSRPIKGNPHGIYINTPVIIKYRDDKTNVSLVLEDILR